MRRLIEPAASVPVGLQARSRMLSATLLSLIMLVVVARGAAFLRVPGTSASDDIYRPVTVLGTLAILGAYALNRAGRYRLAAGVTIAVCALGVWAALYLNHAVPDGAALVPFVLVSVLLSSILLPARATTLLVVAQLAGLLLVPGLLPNLPMAAFTSTYIFIAFVALLIVISARISEHDQAELGRQTRARLESEQRFQQLFAASPDAIVVIDPHHPQVPWSIVDCNQIASQMNGYTRDEMVGQSVDLLNAAPGLASERTAYLERLRSSGNVQLEAVHRHKDGHLFTVEVSTSLLTVSGRELILGIDRDVTARKQAELALQDSNARLSRWLGELEQRTREIALLNDLSEMLQSCASKTEAYAVIVQLGRQLFPDENGALYIQQASGGGVERLAMWGSPTEEEVGLPGFAKDDCWALRRGRLYAGGSDSGALACRHLGQASGPAYLCVPLTAHGESVGLLHLQRTAGGVVDDARRRLAQTVADSLALALANLNLRETLRHQSVRDALTGLFNRRYLEETLEREVRRVTRARRPLGLIMLDIDHFKRFNDTFGHEAGDAVLREFGRFLQGQVRGDDIACRYGGEEFVLILPEATLATTTERAEALRAGVKQLQVSRHGQPLGAISLSLGVACLPQHGASGEVLLRAADAALYRAKQGQRDQVAVAA